MTKKTKTIQTKTEKNKIGKTEEAISKQKEKPTDKPENEKEYVIPLRKNWRKVPRYKRANKAIKTIKEFLARHMKIYDRDLRKIKIDKYLNEAVWFDGIRSPPAKIRVKAIKNGDIINVELSELTEKLKFKKAKLEKREKKAEETISKKKAEEKPKEEKTEEEIKQEEEKKAAVVEAGKEQAKAAAKKAKHQTKVSKQPKRQQRKSLAK